jgi:small subunit ribosomal protein S1
MDGLLHVSDMSWGRIQHPGDLVRVGDELTVKVLKFDRAKGRISLGLKQLTPDPWVGAAERYPVGSLVKGRVVNLVDYGAFLELEPGLEGLVHASEMTSPEQGGRPLSEGQTVEAVVLSLDRQNRKLALSLKRVEPDPWLRVVARYPVGAVLEARIKELDGEAVLLRLEAELDGVLQPDSGRLAELTAGRLVRAAVTGHETQTRRVVLKLTEVLD